MEQLLELKKILSKSRYSVKHCEIEEQVRKIYFSDLLYFLTLQYLAAIVEFDDFNSM